MRPGNVQVIQFSIISPKNFLRYNGRKIKTYKMRINGGCELPLMIRSGKLPKKSFRNDNVCPQKYKERCWSL